MSRLEGKNKYWIKGLLFLSAVFFMTSQQVVYGNDAKYERPSILIVTADDMGFDTPGCFGNKTPDITPNIDRFAEQGIRFEHSFVTSSICQPSRASIITGRLPQHNGVTGFNPITPGVPRLGKVMKDAGYYTGIVMKVDHYAPATNEDWDYINNDLRFEGRDPNAYPSMVEEFLTKAAKAGKPFFLIINITDPHRPYAGSDFEYRKLKGNIPPGPSKVYGPNDIQVPGYLPDTPGMREELKDYYNSVKRCDDSFGKILEAFDKNRNTENSLVMYFSDHGAPLPFAKAGVYRQSVQTPLIIRWPEKIEAGMVDDQHFINGYDFMPTILDIAQIEDPGNMDGKSFSKVLYGKKLKGFNTGYGLYFRGHTAAFNQRAIHEKKWSYIYNEWSAWQHGDLDFVGDNNTPVLYPAAETSKEVAQRIEFYLNRPPEEFYDIENDPWCLNNLASNPDYYDILEKFRLKMFVRLTQTNDPARNSFMFFVNRYKKLKPINGENLIQNPDFEKGDKFWSASNENMRIVIEDGSNVAYVNDNSKKLGENESWVSNKIEITPKSLYSAKIKVDIYAADGARASVRFFDPNGRLIEQSATPLPMRCFAPRIVELPVVKAPVTAVSMDIVVGTFGKGAGIFWFDDIEIIEVMDSDFIIKEAF
jgi:N-sulfoglucosamine sulfohydrolase